MAIVKTNPNLIRDVEKLAIESVKKTFQPILDGVFNELSGRPVEEIKPVLKKRWEAGNDGASLTEPELTKYATEISNGRRIILR